MKNELTLQTSAAFERIEDALIGKTTDDLTLLIFHLNELNKKAKEIQNVNACILTGDC